MFFIGIGIAIGGLEKQNRFPIAFPDADSGKFDENHAISMYQIKFAHVLSLSYYCVDRLAALAIICRKKSNLCRGFGES